MTELSERLSNLIAFIATLISIGFLSKVGGTGADLAIMTALVAVLGMLAQNFRKGAPVGTTESGDVNIKEGPKA